MTRKRTPKAQPKPRQDPVAPSSATANHIDWPEHRKIYSFLRNALSAEDLIALPRLTLDPEIATLVTAELSSGSPKLATLADELLVALQRHCGTLPPTFWEHLIRLRPKREPEIHALRRPALPPTLAPNPSTPNIALASGPLVAEAMTAPLSEPDDLPRPPGDYKVVTRLCLEARENKTLNLLDGLAGAPSTRTTLAQHFPDLRLDTVNGGPRRLQISWTADELRVSAWPSLQAAGANVPDPLTIPLPLTRPLQFQYFPRGVRWRQPPSFGQVVYGLRIVCWDGGLRRFVLFSSSHEFCVEL